MKVPGALFLLPVVLSGCLDAVKGPGVAKAEPAAPTVQATSSLACEDHGPTPHSWKAQFEAKQVDKCVYHQRDDVLEVRVINGEAEVYEVVLRDFKGSGGYQTDVGPKASRVSVIARGGSEGAAVTRVGTETEACKAQCKIEVPDAQVTTVAAGATGSVVLELDCPTLAGPGPGCVTCKVETPAAKLVIPGCSRAD